MFIFVADLILILHFAIVLFISSIFILVPLGYKLNWSFFKSMRLRIIHIGLMIFVTIESIFGLICPLTYLENLFRKEKEYDLFLTYWLSQLIYWDFPSIFFLCLYLLCLSWTIIMWIIFPPREINHI